MKTIMNALINKPVESKVKTSAEMDFIEMEYKYYADGLGLQKVKKLFDGFGAKKVVEVGSWDEYYTFGGNKEQFIRDRLGKGRHRELTCKEKTDPNNNNKRKECNLDTMSNITTWNTFMEMSNAPHLKINNKALFGNQLNVDIDEVLKDAIDNRDYRQNFKIYKQCWIYFMKNNLVYVYYIVYDENFNELNRFIEVEADPNAKWESEEQAREVVLEGERNLASLGITAKNRLKRSLYELYRKDV